MYITSASSFTVRPDYCARLPLPLLHPVSEAFRLRWQAQSSSSAAMLRRSGLLQKAIRYPWYDTLCGAMLRASRSGWHSRFCEFTCIALDSPSSPVVLVSGFISFHSSYATDYLLKQEAYVSSLVPRSKLFALEALPPPTNHYSSTGTRTRVAAEAVLGWQKCVLLALQPKHTSCIARFALLSAFISRRRSCPDFCLTTTFRPTTYPGSCNAASIPRPRDVWHDAELRTHVLTIKPLHTAATINQDETRFYAGQSANTMEARRPTRRQARSNVPRHQPFHERPK